MTIQDIFFRIVLPLLLRIVVAGLVLLVGRWLARFARQLTRRFLDRTPLRASIAGLLQRGVYISVMAVTILTVLTILGVPVEAIVSISGIILVVLGIAWKESLSNLAATINFMIFQPFKEGELVETNGVLGEVKEIQIFSTVLVTADNKEVTLPNNKILDNNLVNYSRLGRLRADLDFSISYTDDLLKAKRVLGELLAADGRVLAEPAANVVVKELAENGVKLSVQPWVLYRDYWAFRSELVERVKLCFDQEGLTMPRPQREVRLRQIED